MSELDNLFVWLESIKDRGWLTPYGIETNLKAAAELSQLRAAITDAREAITAAAHNEPNAYDLLITWLARYPKDTP